MAIAFKYWATGNDFYQWEESDLISNNDLNFWLKLNSELTLSKIDPRFALLYKSERLSFGEYSFFELRNLSPIRSNSIRFLANVKAGKALSMDISNVPIYSMWSNITDGNRLEYLTTDRHNTKNNRISIHVWDYVKFFFNNVAGRHGRFELVESLNDIKNRVNNFHLLTGSTSEVSPVQQSQWLEALSVICHEGSKEIENEIVLEYSKNEDAAGGIDSLAVTEYTSTLLSAVEIKNVLMIFKNSLFKASVKVHVMPENYGQIELGKQELGYLTPSVNDPGRFYIHFVKAELTDDGKTDAPNDAISEFIPFFDE